MRGGRWVDDVRSCKSEKRSGTMTDMARGVVKNFNAERGYGFLVPQGRVGIAERDIFVHLSEVQRSGLTTLSAGVEFELHENHRGRPSAHNLKVLAAER